LASGQPRRIPDVSLEADFAPANPGTRSELCLPLKAEGRVIGMINIESTRLDAFSQADERLMTAFAGQLATAIEKVRLDAEAQQRTGELEAIASVGGLVTAGGNLQATLDNLAGKIAGATRFEGVEIGLYDAERRALSFLAMFNSAPMKWMEACRSTVVHLDEDPVLQELLRDKRYIIFDDPLNDARIRASQRALMAEDGIQTMLTWPLIYGEALIGALDLFSTRSQRFSTKDVNLFSTLADQVAIAIQNARLFADVQRLAITDPLTGLDNRRHFFEIAGREFARARRYSHPLSAIMLDIDHFKQVNDTYGHAAGDQVLRNVALVLQEISRDADIIARYGGEEFVILLPETELPYAKVVAERMRQEISRTSTETERGTVSLTISLGVAVLDEDCADLDALLERADQALYAAKQAGRNRVSI